MSDSTAIEPRHVVEMVPIPQLLRDVGVQIGRDASSGMQVIVIPPGVRQALNVINPVTSLAQADPNWTPAISIVKLDAEIHSYPLPGGKKGLNKQALETLGKAAGVLYTRTRRVPKTELQEGELWAYVATVGFRKSDGTIDELERERGFNAEVERAQVEHDVATGSRTKDLNEAGKAAEVNKRWLNLLKFGPAMTESKAINRALRAGLQMPSSLETAAFGKPFLVIGFNFTPDYDDVEVKRLLVAAGLNARAAIYGGREVSGELGRGDIEATPGGSPADVVEEAAPTVAASDDAEQADGGGVGGTVAAPVGSSEPPLDDAAPAEERGEFSPPDAAIEAAGDFKVTATTASGEQVTKAIRDISEKWIVWALRELEQNETRAALETWARHRLPEVWAEYEAGLASS